MCVDGGEGGGGGGGKLITSVLTLTAHVGPASSSSGWLGKGLLELGGAVWGGSNAEVQRLRDLVQCARVLMLDEDMKQQSVNRHRLSFRQQSDPSDPSDLAADHLLANHPS